jgi:hypothetical protein
LLIALLFFAGFGRAGGHAARHFQQGALLAAVEAR